jgi:hypothetical protein
MTAAAHPTPTRTSMAETGQFRAQAPHSMQSPRSCIRALPALISKTACGQTSTQAPQPVQADSSSLSVSPFRR